MRSLPLSMTRVVTGTDTSVNMVAAQELLAWSFSLAFSRSSPVTTARGSRFRLTMAPCLLVMCFVASLAFDSVSGTGCREALLWKLGVVVSTQVVVSHTFWLCLWFAVHGLIVWPSVAACQV